VSPLLETEVSKRKIISIEEDGNVVEVKLWNEESNKECPVGEIVKLKCLSVDIYKDKYSLNSTKNTTCEILQEDDDFAGTIEAANFDQAGQSVYINGMILKVEERDLDRIFPLGMFTENVSIAGKKRGSTITTIETITHKDSD
ncbi:uncharacterized protein LOC134237933, partial [Saccostrea cucullata]